MAKYNVSVEIASNITLHATLIPGSSASLEHPGDPPEVVDSSIEIVHGDKSVTEAISDAGMELLIDAHWDALCDALADAQSDW